MCMTQKHGVLHLVVGLALPVSLAALICHPNPARAAEFTSVASGDWDRWQTWFGSNPAGTGEGFDYPGPNDDATVSAGNTVDVDTTVSVNDLAIQDSAAGAGGRVDIRANGVLQVHKGIDAEDDLTFIGLVCFNGPAGDTPEIRAMAAGVTLDGLFHCGEGILSGSGRTSSFAVEHGATVTFTNTVLTNKTTIIVNGGSLSIFAAMINNGTLTVDSGDLTLSAATTNNEKIVAAGGTIDFDAAVTNNETVTAESGAITFNGAVTNGGTVWAKGGDVTFAGTITSGSAGRFKVTKDASEMVFDMTAAVCLSPGADFTLSAGLMHFKQTLRTRKDLTFTGGKIVVSAARVFAAGLSACP